MGTPSGERERNVHGDGNGVITGQGGEANMANPVVAVSVGCGGLGGTLIAAGCMLMHRRGPTVWICA